MATHSRSHAKENATHAREAPPEVVPMGIPLLPSSPTPTLPMWLCNLASPAVRVPTRVALVEVPIPMPPLITYLGLTYVWSKVYWCYLQTAAQGVGVSARTDIYASHVADPQY